MRILRLAKAEDFLRESESFRIRDPFRTNLIGSVATSVATGNASYDEYFWWIVKDESGDVVGIAMRTAPHGMVLSPMPTQAALDLAQEISIYDDDLPEVAGPTSIVFAFADGYKSTFSVGSLRDSHIESRQLLYALRHLRIPSVPGEMLPAKSSDFDFVLNWYEEFHREAMVNMPNPTGSVRSALERNALRFWIDGNVRVSMAVFAPLVETPNGTVGRIGPVYTPRESRRKGYAGILTAMVSQELLDIGAKVMLYTDAANPTSNGVYQKIGFDQIDENALIKYATENV